MRFSRLVPAAVSVLLFAASAHAAPCAGFTDVDDASAFCSSVTWLKALQITLGCTSTLFCPNQPVTRLQMAAFLDRLADNAVFQLGGNRWGAVGSAVLGTKDSMPIDVIVGDQRIVRFYEPPDYSIALGANSAAGSPHCLVVNNWSQGHADCFGWSNTTRLNGEHGLSVDYHVRLQGGNGGRWVHIGNQVTGRTIASWTGAYLSDTGIWTNASDAALKEGFEAVDSRATLDAVLSLSVGRWHYLHDGPAIAHIGPTAQDFHTAFGVGRDDKTIGTIDADGVALAAIQGLNAKLEERIAAKDAELAEYRAAIRALTDRLSALESRVESMTSGAER